MLHWVVSNEARRSRDVTMPDTHPVSASYSARYFTVSTHDNYTVGRQRPGNIQYTRYSQILTRTSHPRSDLSTLRVWSEIFVYNE